MFKFIPSKPNYAWPFELLDPSRLWRNRRLSAAFYAAWICGRIASLFSFRRTRRVLMIRTDGIGDAVLFEPALRSFAKHFAGHELHLWAPAASCEVYDGQSYIARRSVIPRGGKAGNLGFFDSYVQRAQVGFLLGRYQFQCAAYLAESPEPLGNWLLTAARTRDRWYKPGDIQNQFAWQQEDTARRSTRLFPPHATGHELARNDALLAEWSDTSTVRDPVIHLRPQHQYEGRLRATTWRNEAIRLDARGLVSIMPASSMAAKGYPPEQWAKVARELWQRERIITGIIQPPDDSDTLPAITRHLQDIPVLSMGQTLPLQATAALVAATDGLLSLDTGLAHMALALDVPTVVLVSGGHPGRFFPWPGERKSIALTHHVGCEGCHCRCHLAQAECLTKITPSDVVDSYLLLRDGRPKRQLPKAA